MFLPSTVVNPLLDVETDIDPLHLYRPIDDATHTVIVGGKVDTLKDIGRAATALNLQQTTDSLRFTHGTNSTTGKQFMSSSDGTHTMDDVVGAIADWEFTCKLENGDGCTIACITTIDSLDGNNVVMNTNTSLSTLSFTNGFYLMINGSAATRGLIFRGDAGTGSIELIPRNETVGKVPSTYVTILRYRKIDPVLGEDVTEGELRSNGVSLVHNTPRANNFDTTNPVTNVLEVGSTAAAASSGVRGETYELVLDDRWWSDNLVRRYEERAFNDFGADRMIFP